MSTKPRKQASPVVSITFAVSLDVATRLSRAARESGMSVERYSASVIRHVLDDDEAAEGRKAGGRA